MSKNLAVIGGAMGGGGGDGGGSAARTPVTAPDSVRSQAIIEIVEAWAVGEIKCFADGADPLQHVYLDGTPIKAPDGALNFQGVTFDYRPGTQDQTYIPGIVDDTIGSPESINVTVTHNTPIIHTVNDPAADAIRVIVTFNGLVVQDTVNGDKSAVTVNLQIEVRPAGGAWTVIDLQGRGTIRDKTESPYQRSFHINLRAVDPVAASYDIRLTRLSADPASNENSAFKWDSIVKLTYAKLRRPNIAYCRLTFDSRYFSSIPVRSYDLMGWLIQVPTADVYDPVLRTYTGADWTGTLVKRWCRNPAWFLYHLLTTAGAGLGGDIAPAYQDKWAIYTIAKRCDELVSDGNAALEPRYSIDAQFMAQTSAHDMIMQLAGIFDAQALWNGTSVYLTQDAPKVVSSLYLPANVVGGRFTYSGTARQVRYTAAMIQYNDTTDQYKLATEYVEDFDGIQRYGFRPKTETAIGCTSRGEAHRRGKRLLVTGRKEIDTVSFSTGLGGINDKPGDIIRIADPLRTVGKRLGGRLSTGSTASVIQLDAPVVLSGGVSYRLAIIGNDGAVWDKAITTAAGTHSAITVSPAFAAAPEHELEWIVYDPLAIGKTFRVLGIAENEDASNGFYTLSATQYDVTKFAEIDDTADLEPVPANPYIVNSVTPPSGLTVQEGVYTALEGLRRYMDLHWTASNDALLRGYHLTYRHNGATLFDQEVTGQSYRIINPLAGTYEITLSSVTITGKYSSSITISHVLGELYAVESVSVTGLALKAGGSTYTGKISEFVWGTDALTVLGFSDTYGVGAGGQSPWFRDFQVDVYTTSVIPTLLRSDFVTESTYAYTFEKNIEDGGPRRSVTLKIRARDYYGRYSIPAEITVTNPAPPELLVNNVDIYAGYKSLLINYLRPPDNDWEGVIVFLGTTTGFTPSAGNQVYMGADVTITIPDLLEDTPYFIRLATYDAFGGATDYTLGVTEYTKLLASVTLPSPAEVKASLQAALDDASATPLVFQADTFAVKLNATEVVPFIIGTHNGNPAILMDASVVITGDLSADQIKSGRMAATESITIGNGGAIIDGDGSIIVYDGPDTVNNRDFALFTGGNLSFQRYRDGAYHTYKSVRRIEYGQAQSGQTVVLPGYWDAQPKIIVSPSSLRGYDAAQSSSSQAWQIRADNLSTELVETYEQQPLTLAGTATIAGTTISKASGVDNWDTHAYSSTPMYKKCAVRAKFDYTNKHAMIALNSDPATNASYTSLDYAIWAHNNGSILIYESNAIVYNTAVGSTAPFFTSFLTTDVFEVAYDNGQIIYKKNGVAFRTVSAGSWTRTFYIDSSLFTVGVSISGIEWWGRSFSSGSYSIWQFDAVAELTYAASAGNITVANVSGALSSDTWNSGQSTLPINTVSINVTAQFSSVKGNGTSTYGFYFRTVTWKIQGWNGTSWIDLATKVRSLAQAEHGQLITDQNSTNLTAGVYSAVRLNFVASNTNGSIYSLGTTLYEYTQATILSNGASVTLANGQPTVGNVSYSAYNPPGGYSIYEIKYSLEWTHHLDGLGYAPVSSLAWSNGNYIYSSLYVDGGYWDYTGDYTFIPYDADESGLASSGFIPAASFDTAFWQLSIQGGGSGVSGTFIASNPTAIVNMRRMIANSATPSNNFTFQSYAWNISGSTAIATGSLNWMAVGD